MNKIEELFENLDIEGMEKVMAGHSPEMASQFTTLLTLVDMRIKELSNETSEEFLCLKKLLEKEPTREDFLKLIGFLGEKECFLLLKEELKNDLPRGAIAYIFLKEINKRHCFECDDNRYIEDKKLCPCCADIMEIRKIRQNEAIILGKIVQKSAELYSKILDGEIEK